VPLSIFTSSKRASEYHRFHMIVLNPIR